MTPTRLGGTIALPNYSNIKIEVEGNSYSHTKALLRVTLENMYNPHNALPIETWWLITFGEAW
jgi:hypothetical protein